MSTGENAIAIKAEPIGVATRVTGMVGGREVICVSNSVGGVWTVGGSSCLPTDLELASRYLECMRRAMARAREYGAPNGAEWAEYASGQV